MIKKLIAVVVILCGLATIAATLVRSTVYVSTDETTQEGATTTLAASSPPRPDAQHAATGTPERIRIPSIGVDASLEHVGLGIPAVFARLGELKAGDDIYIEDAEGNEIHFVVEDDATYPVAEVPLQKIFNRSDQARLNLITCDGTWIPDEKMYDERHVVYAVLAT